MFNARATLTRISLLGFAAVTSFVVGACFNGIEARGLPCETDAQCGPGDPCTNGYCGGVFLCDEDVTIDAMQVCDEVTDCTDGADESFALCFSDLNVCSGSDGTVRFEVGPSQATMVDEPAEVLAVDIMGSMTTDMIVGSRGGNTVQVVFELEADAPLTHELGAPGPSFDGRPIVAYKLGEVNGDMHTDVVVFAGSSDSGGGIYVYQNNRPDLPTLFGTAVELPGIGVGEVVPDIMGVELGRLNNDASVDVVAVVDAGPLKGSVLTSLGDSNAAGAGGGYFNPQVLDGASIPYETFASMAVADVDGDNFDDLLVTGFDGDGPKLWLMLRGPGDMDDWTLQPAISLSFPGRLSLGRYRNSPSVDQDLGPRPDIALLDPMNGRVQTLLNSMGPQAFMTGPAVSLVGDDVTGLALADLNCDGQADFVYNAGSLGEVHVLFGDGDGDVISPLPLRIPVEGMPVGKLAFDDFDEDGTPDIFSASAVGNGLSAPQVQALISNQGDRE